MDDEDAAIEKARISQIRDGRGSRRLPFIGPRAELL
jgi:hypothetical protein